MHVTIICDTELLIIYFDFFFFLKGGGSVEYNDVNARVVTLPLVIATVS